jgi:hypothetical protein
VGARGGGGGGGGVWRRRGGAVPRRACDAGREGRETGRGRRLAGGWCACGYVTAPGDGEAPRERVARLSLSADLPAEA